MATAKQAAKPDLKRDEPAEPEHASTARLAHAKPKVVDLSPPDDPKAPEVETGGGSTPPPAKSRKKGRELTRAVYVTAADGRVHAYAAGDTPDAEDAKLIGDHCYEQD